MKDSGLYLERLFIPKKHRAKFKDSYLIFILDIVSISIPSNGSRSKIFFLLLKLTEEAKNENLFIEI